MARQGPDQYFFPILRAIQYFGPMTSEPQSEYSITPDQRMEMAAVQCNQSSRGLGWHRIRAENYPDLPESDIRLPGMDHHLLVYHYKALNGEFYHECAGHKSQTILQDGQLSFIPAGADNRWKFGKGAPSALHLMVHKDLFHSTVKRDRGGQVSGDLRDDFQVTSPKLEAIAKLFATELSNKSGTQLYLDSLATALCCQLGETFLASVSPKRKTRDVSLARDIICAEMERNITLSELANLCNTSQSQLVRSFKKQFGHAPHQYQTLRRIDRAKHMLKARANVSMAELAMELGFSDQSHFGRHFKAVTGHTPGAFRAKATS